MERQRGLPTPSKSSSVALGSTRARLSRRLLGESFHPGGAALTERLGQLLGLTPESRVLDAASGKGTSALLLAQTVRLHASSGVDLSDQNVAHATAEADRLGLAGRVSFEVGDAEQLPLDDASVDAVICECAFCTFPDKPLAATRVRARAETRRAGRLERHHPRTWFARRTRRISWPGSPASPTRVRPRRTPHGSRAPGSHSRWSKPTTTR